MAHILWLASWWPDALEPVNGDFVQRHAECVALYMPLQVIHVAQAGSHISIPKAFVEQATLNNLEIAVHVFAFKPYGIAIIDKFRYQWIYFNYYKKIIQEYIAQKGKPQLIHVHVPMKAGLLALYLKYFYQIPYIVSEHASYYDENATHNFFERSWFFRYFTKTIFQQAAAATNVSATIGKKIQQICSLKSITTIHNTVNTSLFYYQKNSAPPAVFRFIHVSSLKPQKNITGILQALVLLSKLQSNWQFVFVGPVTPEIEKMATRLNLSSFIIFTGELSYANVALQMQQAHAFVLFSNYENFPCVVVEALCCGLPVITSEVGGVQEAVDESNGKIVPQNNINALANAMNELREQYNQFNRESIAQKAQAKYAYSVIGKQFVELYKKVLKMEEWNQTTR